MKNVRVSVIIPVHNAERFVRRCIESVQHQSLKDIEIICIDDGSCDRSASVIAALAAKDRRIILLRQENLNAGVARNVGIGKICCLKKETENIRASLTFRIGSFITFIPRRIRSFIRKDR